MSINTSKWHVFFVTKMYRPQELKERCMYGLVQKNLSCNLTCYNVQYVCIVFDWGNFYAERNFSFFRTYIFDPYLYCAIPDLCSLFTSAYLLQFKLKQLADAQPWFLCYDLIQLYGLSWSQYGASTKLMLYGVMKNSGLVLHSCFSLKLLYLI